MKYTNILPTIILGLNLTNPNYAQAYQTNIIKYNPTQPNCITYLSRKDSKSTHRLEAKFENCGDTISQIKLNGGIVTPNKGEYQTLIAIIQAIKEENIQKRKPIISKQIESNTTSYPATKQPNCNGLKTRKIDSIGEHEVVCK